MGEPASSCVARSVSREGAGWIQRENPARTDELAGRVRADCAASVETTVGLAAAAQQRWAETDLEARIARFEAAAAAFEDVADLADQLAREMGKPIAECEGEIRFALSLAADMSQRGRRLLPDADRGAGTARRIVRRKPHGVVGAIVPWNAPIILTMTKLAPALVSGNAFVVKPSPLAPVALTRFIERLAQGFPAGLVGVVNGGGEVGDSLVRAPEVARIAFTGGPEVGRTILRAAAERFIPCVMELGGNDPLVILDDFIPSPDLMEAIVWASFLNAGQVCMAAKRLFVPKARARDFTEAYVETARRLFRIGDPLDRSTNLGPVINAEARDRIERLAADSAARGGRVVDLVADGSVLPATGYFVTPRLATGLDAQAALVRKEQFGPIVPLVTYEDEEDLMPLIAAGGPILSASVWSPDLQRAWGIASRIGAGLCLVNAHNRSGFAMDLPFGGSGGSGYGREYADEGLLEYSVPQSLHAPAATGAGAHYPGRD